MYAQIIMYIMLIFKVNDDQNLTKLMYLEVHAEIKLVQTLIVMLRGVDAPGWGQRRGGACKQAQAQGV